MKIEKVGVVGLGVMGAGIAQVTAQAGYRTDVHDISREIIDMAVTGIERSLARLAEKGNISGEELTKSKGRLTPRLELEGLKDCDLVIEAVAEDIGVKKNVFVTIDKVNSDQMIFASNTSTLPIAEMAAGVKHPERFVGLHFFNPAPLMKLVEVVKTPVTDPEVLETAKTFVESLGKVPVVTKDRGGFLVNLLLTPFIYDAMRALDNGMGNTEDIDRAMVLGCGHPIGPLKLADYIGLDILAKGVLFDEFKEKRFSPPAILRRLVALGFYGRKSGRGFYDWSDPKNPVPIDYD
jgi:3-hydroxybutyryl-CoA dehydrogenase